MPRRRFALHQQIARSAFAARSLRTLFGASTSPVKSICTWISANGVSLSRPSCSRTPSAVSGCLRAASNGPGHVAVAVRPTSSAATTSSGPPMRAADLNRQRRAVDRADIAGKCVIEPLPQDRVVGFPNDRSRGDGRKIEITGEGEFDLAAFPHPPAPSPIKGEGVRSLPISLYGRGGRGVRESPHTPVRLLLPSPVGPNRTPRRRRAGPNHRRPFRQARRVCVVRITVPTRTPRLLGNRPCTNS